MRLNDPRRMDYCHASSHWSCDYPECGCNLTYEDPPAEKKSVNGIFCPKCGTVLYKSFNTAEIYSLKIKCSKCKNTFSVNRDKDHLTIKISDV